MFQQWVQDNIKNLQFSDKVEMDESLFGRRVKFHHCGNPNMGVKVWVVTVQAKIQSSVAHSC